MKSFWSLQNNFVKKYLNNIVVLNLFLACAYFLLAKLGLTLATLNNSVSPVWPATGFAISAIYIFGFRAWPSIFIGAFIANYFPGGALGTSFVISIGNSLEAIIGGLLIMKINSLQAHLNDHTDTISFTVASFLSSFFGATIGVCALFVAGVVTRDGFSSVWLTWWIGDSLGGLVIAPILLSFKNLNSEVIKKNKVFITLLLLGLISSFVFVVPWGGSFLFLLFPILLFGVFYLNKTSVLVLSALISFIGVAFTVSDLGPFALGTMNERLVHLQLFLAAIAISGLALSGFGKESLTRIPVSVLLLCWTLSGALFYSFDRSERKATEIHFKSLVKESEQKIKNTLNSYEGALRGGASLFSASKSVERDEWHAYMKTLGVEKYFPGMIGIGVIWPIRDREIPSLLKEMKNQGHKDFTLKSVPGSDGHFQNKNQTHYVIKFLEPELPNSKALGLDVGSNPVRRQAADLARDSGIATITSKIILVQGGPQAPGFLFLLPIYKNNKSVNTIDERRTSHMGWIYGALSFKSFFSRSF